MNQPIHDHNTRFKSHIKPKSHRLEKFHLSPQYAGPKIYNKLPNHFKNINGCSKFRTTLKAWLKTKNFYSINNFLERDITSD